MKTIVLTDIQVTLLKRAIATEIQSDRECTLQLDDNDIIREQIENVIRHYEDLLNEISR